jgi:hypothetical protein
MEPLTRIILWLLIGFLVYSFALRAFPQQPAVTRIAIVVMIIILLLAFLVPQDGVVAQLWNVLSFPLKPLGAAILLMFLAVKDIKDGSVAKPGGNLMLWALVILLLSSTPAIAYLLTRIPGVVAMAPPIERPVPEFAQNVNFASSLAATAQAPEAVVAMDTRAFTSYSSGDKILDYAAQKNPDFVRASLAFNPVTAPALANPSDLYLLQAPQDIPRRGLRLVDFVPSAQTLSVTTQAWEGYLARVGSFLRGR